MKARDGAVIGGIGSSSVTVRCPVRDCHRAIRSWRLWRRQPAERAADVDVVLPRPVPGRGTGAGGPVGPHRPGPVRGLGCSGPVAALHDWAHGDRVPTSRLPSEAALEAWCAKAQGLWEALVEVDPVWAARLRPAGPGPRPAGPRPRPPALRHRRLRGAGPVEPGAQLAHEGRGSRRSPAVEQPPHQGRADDHAVGHGARPRPPGPGSTRRCRCTPACRSWPAAARPPHSPSTPAPPARPVTPMTSRPRRRSPGTPRRSPRHGRRGWTAPPAAPSRPRRRRPRPATAPDSSSGQVGHDGAGHARHRPASGRSAGARRGTRCCSRSSPPAAPRPRCGPARRAAPRGVVPRSRARTDASWMVGPSIIGSEKGMPTSMASAPASATAWTTSSQSADMPPVT